MESTFLKEGLDILILFLDTAKAQPPKISMNGLAEHRRKFYPTIEFSILFLPHDSF